MYELVIGFNKVRNVDLEEYEAFIKAKSYISFYLQFEELYEFVKVNFIDFWNYLFKICEQYRLYYISDFSELIDPVLFSNQKLANILSSFRTYQDYLKHIISETLGDKSTEYKTFEKILVKIYDSNFSYRFFYRLRNYIQHCGLPIKKISYDAKLMNKEPIEWAQFVNLKIDRDMLLKFQGWSTVKKEIIKLPDFFEIKPLINDYFNSLNIIHSKMRDALLTQYTKKKSILENLYFEAVNSTNLSNTKNNLTQHTFIFLKENDVVLNKEYIMYNVIIRIDNFINRNTCSNKKGISYSLIK
jgi:hypothetical protein